MTILALIVAAGRGLRAGGELPKQYQSLAGMPVLARSINALSTHRNIDATTVVIHPDDSDLYRDLVVPHLKNAGITVVHGGENRGDSVLNGLHALPSGAGYKVLIHDGARPLLSANLIDALIDKLTETNAVAPALAITDALWRGEDGQVKATVDRSNLYRAQTPQGFDLATILQAYAALNSAAADDVEVARLARIPVTIIPGEERNIKITFAEDYLRAAKLIRGIMDVRCGNGYDVHAFETGDHVVLCGLKIPHDHALKGHSDADVAMHALTDAIYGALCAGDIGQHFPPSETRWKGAASSVFLLHAVNLAEERGFKITHLDCTIICEAPKIGPHAMAMRENLANISKISSDRISVKATTSEQLGFTGRGEGIAAQASATLVAL